ncbi:F-box/LRR-repeat protein-like [Iris pallida]|uniref:F-box/LRR-repeat protein-like n=1 Tax=Iris pallida TaxID=29817 RepID=A0AAX6DGX3_IRIPA|nr:F-box/LRR-repeat protein-like [Iris pallida]KAJ6817974.1 F-box/LRR-repeat protein-like [Iris pallida]KAJ6835715.1 F-box/LRR-repeat protein-like [Iris pallida]
MNLHYTVELGQPKIMGRLRRLHIQCSYQKHGLMENLISSCPVLEDLDLHNCELGALCISSNTLKRLSIKDCKIGGNENLISTPGLVCLTYTNNSACTTLENLSSLLNATVHTTGDHAIKLIRGLANVETLNFSCSEDYQHRRCLLRELGGFPMFDNLRSLTLCGQYTSDNIQALTCLLQHSPNLKTFILNNREVSSPLSLSSWEAT